jgi:hypothetical protein
MKTKTETAIRTAPAINGTNADIAKMINDLKNGWALHDKKGALLGIEKQNGEKVWISDWEHKVLATFKNVRFRTPREDDPYLKFIDNTVTLLRNGNILEVPGYWRRGVWVPKKMVTITYRMAGNQISTKALPLGVEAVGRVEIRERRNSRTKEVNIIVDYYLYPSPTTTTYEVKIGGKKRENTVFSTSIPDTTEFVVVNKIG